MSSIISESINGQSPVSLTIIFAPVFFTTPTYLDKTSKSSPLITLTFEESIIFTNLSLILDLPVAIQISSANFDNLTLSIILIITGIPFNFNKTLFGNLVEFTLA